MNLISVLGLGALGAIGYLLLGMYKNGFKWVSEDRKKLLHIGLGMFASFAAALLGLPNHFNSLLVGWLAPIFLEQVMKGTERIRSKK
ncbi:MAG: hypothetical protein ACTSRC_20495 [Candidatus Helarchaeota archaeon]